MLTGIHFLLTYTCNFECDHCFLYCGPRAEGTFSTDQIRETLEEAKKLGSVEWIYFEGGEPFLYYPVLVEGLRMATEMGFKTGVVSNCYWATSQRDAELWLRPLVELGVSDLSLSDDAFHHGDKEDSPASLASKAASALGLEACSICIEEPKIDVPKGSSGEPVVGGGALFKGRAVEKLTEGMPTKPKDSLCECKHEELKNPKRVHVDALGNVQVCQGISIGNMWEKPLSNIVSEYDVSNHPISGPLDRGGPVDLAKTHGIDIGDEFVDECHYCFTLRYRLIERFPEYLTPVQVYGL